MKFFNADMSVFEMSIVLLSVLASNDSGFNLAVLMERIILDVTFGGVGPTRKLLESSKCILHPSWIEKSM